MRDQHEAGLGGLIARLREQQGWSQRALAEWVGMDQSAVSRIEAGRRRVSADELQRFADAFRVSADILLRGAPGETTATGEPTTPAQSRPARALPEPPAAALRPAPQLGRAAPRDVEAVPSAPEAQRPAAPPEARADAEWSHADAPWPAPDAATSAIGAGEDWWPLRMRATPARSASLLPQGGGSPAVPMEPAEAGDDATPDRLGDRRAAEIAAPQARRLAAHAGAGRLRTPPAPSAALPAVLAASGRAWAADVGGVVDDWFRLRRLAESREPETYWSTGRSADGRPARAPWPIQPGGLGAPGAAVLYDRVARFWRGELHVAADDGPLPDLVPLLEGALGIQVIVARVGGGSQETASPSPADVSGASGVHATSLPRPVAAAFAAGDVPFVFVNAARPVVLQRYALAHAFAHLVLGHGDVVDESIGWSRSNPREAAANDLAEEFMAPVRAVQRWYDRHPLPDRRPSVDALLDLANAFGISVWAALFRSLAAERVTPRQTALVRSEMRSREWELLPHQAFLGGVRDTLTHLTPDEVLEPGAFGRPAVLRVPAQMRTWALRAVRARRLSLEDAAAALHIESGALAQQLARLGLE